MRLAAGAVLVSLVLLGAWGAAGWPGEPVGCLATGDYFCEEPRPGPLRQPVNTLSNIGFIVVGLALAARARTKRAQLLAAVIALLGPGSMALHGSLTQWGGILDVLSMYLFIGYMIAHATERLWRAPFYRTFAALFSSLTLAQLAWPKHGDLTFAVLVAGYVLLELKRGLAGREGRWVAAAVGCFAAGTAVWLPSRRVTDFLCAPNSLLQAHAVWHLFCALAAGSLYKYLEPEL